MVRPAARRARVHWAREAHQVSERRAWRAVGVERSRVRYRSRRPAQQPLRTRLRELASVRLRAGCPHLHVRTSPGEFRAGGAFIPDRSRLQFARG
jgi:putative transposase